MKSKPLDGAKKKKKGGKKRILRGPTVAAMKSSKPPPKPNPFETIWSRRKFDIVGKKKGKGEEVRIGLSRSLAMEKRKKTLMKEYEESNKASKFIDRRLGEKDDSLPEFNKAILRMQRERQLKAKRERKYNLSDEEEDDPIDPRAVLLSKEDDFNEQVPLDDDDDDHGSAGASDLPGHLHLHSETDPSEHNLLDGTEIFHGRKSNKQAYADVMAKDKYYKAKRAVEREEINREIAALNKLTDGMEDRLKLLNSLDWKHSGDKPSDDTYDTYNKIIGELHFEPRARPSDRMKTPEELALEEREALEKKEKERLKRMHASDDDDDDDDDDEDSDDSKGQSKPLPKMDRYISGDDLGDSFSTVKDVGNGKGWVDDIYEREKNEDNHEEDSSSAEDSESMEDDQEGSDDSDGKDGDEADGIEYDKISSMKDWEKSDDDDDDVDNDPSDEVVTQNLSEKGIIKVSLDSEKSEPTDHYQVDVTEKTTRVKEEIPFVIQAPKTLSEICSLLDNHSDTEVVEIIRRIRAYNSINLGADNRRKMQVFYGVLLSYFATLATQKPLNVKIINSLVKPLIEMGTEVPYFASVCARERLVHTRKQLCEDVKIPGKSSWPSLKTINLLRLWSLTFPCSDFRHVVITPAILLICEYLTRCPITSGRDIAVGSFLCSMALSVAKQSLKYFPEVLNFLQTVLMSCMEKNFTLEYLAQSDMELNVLQPWLLIRDEGCNVHPIDVFTVLEMDAESSYFNSDNFKASILSIVIKILKEFASIYERLSSFPEIFLPIAALLHGVLQVAKIPCILQADINDAVGLIRKKISEQHELRQPLQMRKQKPEPIKLLNPKFEENFVKGIDYDPDRERAQRKKLKKLLKKESKGAVRELRKDNHFIFKLKERDRLLQEEERAEKYGKALAFLQEQEHAFKSGQLGKGRKKRK